MKIRHILTTLLFTLILCTSYGGSITTGSYVESDVVTGTQSNQIAGAAAHTNRMATTAAIGHVKAGASGTASSVVYVDSNGKLTAAETDPSAMSAINSYLYPLYHPTVYTKPNLPVFFDDASVLETVTAYDERGFASPQWVFSDMNGYPMTSVTLDIYDQDYMNIVGTFTVTLYDSLTLYWDGTVSWVEGWGWDGDGAEGYIGAVVESATISVASVTVSPAAGESFIGLKVPFEPSAMLAGVMVGVYATINETQNDLWGTYHPLPMGDKVSFNPLPGTGDVTLLVDFSGIYWDWYTWGTQFQGVGFYAYVNSLNYGLTFDVSYMSEDYQQMIPATQVTNLVDESTLISTNFTKSHVLSTIANYYTKSQSDGRYATASAISSVLSPLYYSSGATHFITNFTYKYSTSAPLNGRKVWEQAFTNFVVTPSAVTIMLNRSISSALAAIAGDFLNLEFSISGMSHYEGVYKVTSVNAGLNTFTLRPNRYTATMGIATSVYSNVSIGLAGRAHPMFVVSHTHVSGTSSYVQYSLSFDGLIAGAASSSGGSLYGWNLGGIESTVYTYGVLYNELNPIFAPHSLGRSTSVSGNPFRLAVWFDASGNTAGIYSNIVCVVPDFSSNERFDLSRTDDTNPRIYSIEGTVTYRSIRYLDSLPTFVEAWGLSSK